MIGFVNEKYKFPIFIGINGIKTNISLFRMRLKCPFQLLGNHAVDISLIKESYAGATTCGSVVIKPRPNGDPIYELGHWVTGSTST